MEITSDYLFKTIGIERVQRQLAEEEAGRLKKEYDELKIAFDELQKTIKTQTEDV